MKSVKLWLILVLLLGVFVASNALAAGQVKLVPNDSVVDEGEPVGVYMVLSGDGVYDVYVTLTGGLLGEALFYFKPDLYQFELFTPVAYRSGLDLASLSVDDKLLYILPEIELPGIPGVYTFRAFLANPGDTTPVAEDSISVELK